MTDLETEFFNLVLNPHQVQQIIFTALAYKSYKGINYDTKTN